MRQLITLFLFFLLSSCLYGFAQAAPPVVSLDQEIEIEAEKIKQLLKAYQFESIGDLEKAKIAWKALPNSPTKANHLFFIQFYLNKPSKPNSKTQVLFQANYYLWRHHYGEAKKLLESTANLSSSGKILLVHAQLALGQYKKAAAALEKFKPKNLEEKEKVQLSWLWYYQLTEQDQKAQETWNKIVKEFLYQDFGNLVLSGVSPKPEEIEKAILLQLSSANLLEKLFFSYTEESKKIAFIEENEGDLTGWVVHSALIPRDFRPPKVQIFEFLASRDSTPNDFERWANYWLRQKQGEKLKKLGEVYPQRCPNFEDGRLYSKQAVQLITAGAVN